MRLSGGSHRTSSFSTAVKKPTPYTTARSRAGKVLEFATRSMNIYQGEFSVTFRSFIRFLFDFVLIFIKDPLYNASHIKTPADE